MKYFRSVCAIALLVALGRAALPPWAAEAVSASALEAALFRSMALPDGPVLHLRPPVETRVGLTNLIRQTPTPELYGIRAREEERAGDYTAAEADWKQAPPADLPSYYARRVEPAKEVAALLRVGSQPDSPNQRFLPESQRPQWVALEHAVAVSQEALLPAAQQTPIYEAWIARYPRSVEPYQAYLHWALQTQGRTAAAAIANRLKAAFPQDEPLAVTTDAELAGDGALAVYAKSFSPLWPESLRTSYFQQLTDSQQLRTFLADAQSAAATNPDQLRPISQVFFYYEARNQKPAADAALLRFVARREAARNAWTPDELKTIAALLLRVQDYDEAARFSYLLNSSPAASASDREAGLAALISLLLEVPEQPLSFANRDLSLYKNIATMDRHPGFLNGILTVALNSTYPSEQYATNSETAASYFHRAAASRLLDKLKTDFPASTRLPELEATLFNVYALYAQDAALLRDVPGWLTRNANAAQYVATAMLLADAYSRGKKTPEELALYDLLLQTLAEKSGHMPIGNATVAASFQENTNAEDKKPPPGARSPDYARVLDRYISRLVELKRLPAALTLLRREIDRNPEDAGLYERLALFVEQNHFDNDLEQTYRTAFAHFKDTSWASKLARLYLRSKRSAAYEALSREITDTFKGTQLAEFLNEVPADSPTLYRQVNLYAHTRFPHNVQFVTNLLHAYSVKPTLDTAAYTRLLRDNWFNDAGLRTLYLESLTRDGKLRAAVAALPSVAQSVTDRNMAALEFRAEAQSWLTEYEGAAPVLVRLAALTPGERDSNNRAIAVERSLAPLVPGALENAVRLARQDVTAAPGDRAAVVRTGEVFADREQYAQARTWWLRSAAIHPGAPDGYLDAATVFWDYLQFDDALRIITDGRTKLKDPSLYAYEAGAINENQGRYKEAVTEYTQACLRNSSEIAQRRLLTLARRPATSALVETQTAGLVSNAFDEQAFTLRIAILENQNRRSELQTLLTRLAATADSTNETDAVRKVTNRLGFDDVAAQTLVRTVAITKDPIEKMGARLELAHFYEGHKNPSAAEREYTSLVTDEPNRLGVVRASVDYEWRSKQWNKAVRMLEAAADRAQQPYQNQLRREAAEKAATSGEYAEARRLLDKLLASDRYNGDLLAEKASTYAREGDNAGLAKFYSASLTDMLESPVAATEKMSRVAALRRGYILALTTARQFPEALEQYQLVLNAYPEDASLPGEVGRFAEAHQLAPRVVSYYEKATKDSPRDYRWPLILARLQTTLGHFSEAISAYDKAGFVRPDRSDMPLAKADLQVRLLRFADVIQTNQKLYELSYHDRQYLAGQADAYARLGNRTEALRLLRAAYLEPHPQEPGGYVTAMQQLSTWHQFDVVDSLFQELRPLLAAKPEWNGQALTIELQALVALHRTSDAINLAAGTSRKADEATPLINVIALAAKMYLTPAEKFTLAQQIEKPGGLPAQFNALQFAEALELRDVQARILFAKAQPATDKKNWQALNQLQTARFLFAEAGRDLESLAPSRRRARATYQQIQLAAFQAFAKAGDKAAQQRLRNYSGGEYANLFVGAGGDLNRRLYDLAGQDTARANAVVQYLLASASADTVHEAIAARGRRISPLWTNSYTALTGLYLLSPSAWAREAFAAVLGPRTVGAELSGRSAKDVLRGSDWFYYAGRYGDYLDNGKNPELEEYRAATLEAAPADLDSYVSLGDVLMDARHWDAAEVQYENALQLKAGRADVYDRLGLLAMERKQRNQGIAHWRRALQMLTSRVEEGPLPPEYWTTAKTLLGHVNQFNVAAELLPDIRALLSTYVKRNGLYEITPLLEGLLQGAPNRQTAVNVIIELAQLSGANGLLREVVSNPDLIAAPEKDALYQAQLALSGKAANSAAGEAGNQAQSELRQIQLEYVGYLEDQDDGQKCGRVFNGSRLLTAPLKASYKRLPSPDTWTNY